MRGSLRLAGLLALTALAAGCSTVGIYDNEFSCPNSYNGRCVSLPEAHRLATKGEDGPQFDPAVKKAKKDNSESAEAANSYEDVLPFDPAATKAKKTVASGSAPNTLAPGAGEEAAHSQYKESLYKRLDSLVREPKAPMVAPAQVMRVLLLPYKGEGNELYMLRHVYFFVDDPKWVVNDSAVATDEEE